MTRCSTEGGHTTYPEELSHNYKLCFLDGREVGSREEQFWSPRFDV